MPSRRRYWAIIPYSHRYSYSWRPYTRCYQSDILNCIEGEWSRYSSCRVDPITLTPNTPEPASELTPKPTTPEPTTQPVDTGGNTCTFRQQGDRFDGTKIRLV